MDASSTAAYSFGPGTVFLKGGKVSVCKRKLDPAGEGTHAYRVERHRPDSLGFGGLEAVDRVENFLAVQTVLHAEAALEVVVVQVVQEGSVHRRCDKRLLILSQG